MMTAGRVVLILSGEYPPEGMDACHKPVICHQPLCINKSHLEWKTRKGNCQDMILDKTYPRGTKNSQSKLNEKDIFAIREMAIPYKDIATLYEVDPSTISDIKTGRTWSWL